MKFHFFSVFSFITLAHVVIIIGVSLRVIKVRPPVAADRGQKSEVRNQKSEDRWQRKENRGQKAERIVPGAQGLGMKLHYFSVFSFMTAG